MKGGDVNSDEEVKGCGRGDGDGELSRSIAVRCCGDMSFNATAINDKGVENSAKQFALCLHSAVHTKAV